MPDTDEARWQYTTKKSPVNHRMAADESPDHKFYYIRRVDRMVPHASKAEYHARCSCKWQARDTNGRPLWSVSLRQAKGNHEEHFAQAEKHGILLDTSLRSPWYYE